MDQIQLEDKTFTLYLEKERLQKRVAEMAQQIREDYADKKPLFIVVLKGSFFFAADILRNAGIEADIAFTQISSYQGMSSTGNITSKITLDTPLQNRHLIIVEDIVDSGKTLHYLLNWIKQQNPASVATATCLHKPSAVQYEVPLHYMGFEIGEEFVVGYGLDYNEMGRNLNHIYRHISTPNETN